MRSSASYLIVVLFVLFCPGTVFGQDPTNGVRVTVAPDQSEVVLHEPIVVRLTIENRSVHQIHFDLGRDGKSALQLSLRAPDGTRTEFPRLPMGGFAPGGRVVLQPLDVYERRYILDEWMKPTEPGLYEFGLEIDTTFLTSDGRSLNRLGTQAIRIVVGDSDDDRLRKTSDRLAHLAINGASAQTRIDAVRALTLVGAPVAVSSMVAILNATTLFDTEIAMGLSRIGDSAARRALETMARTGDVERVQIASDALSRLR